MVPALDYGGPEVRGGTTHGRGGAVRAADAGSPAACAAAFAAHRAAADASSW